MRTIEFSRPRRFALILFALFLYSGIIGHFPVVNMIPVNFGWLCIIGAFCYSCFLPGALPRAGRSFVFVVIFLLLSGPSLILNYPIDTAKYLNLMGLIASLSFLSVSLLREEKDLHFYLKTLAILGLIISVQTIIFGTPGSHLRIQLYGSNPIWLGRFVSFFPYWLFLLLLNGKISALRFTMLLPVLYVMLMTGSRGPLVSLIIGALVLVIRSLKPLKLRLQSVLSYYLFFFTSFLGVILFANRIPTNLLERFNVLSGGDSGRQNIYAQALRLIREHPLGIGPGKYSQYQLPFRYPHNVFLEATLEFGWLFGFSLALVLVYVFSLVLQKVLFCLSSRKHSSYQEYYCEIQPYMP